jgi:hypothetical protein
MRRGQREEKREERRERSRWSESVVCVRVCVCIGYRVCKVYRYAASLPQIHACSRGEGGDAGTDLDVVHGAREGGGEGEGDHQLRVTYVISYHIKLSYVI